MEPSDYEAPEVWVETMRCERGYASSDWDHSLLPTPSGNGNTASEYEHTTWEW